MLQLNPDLVNELGWAVGPDQPCQLFRGGTSRENFTLLIEHVNGSQTDVVAYLLGRERG